MLTALEFADILGKYKGATCRTGISQFLDVVQKMRTVKAELVGYVVDNPFVGLMADYVVELFRLHSVTFAYVFKGGYQEFASVHEDIAAFRHGDSVFMRTEAHAVGAFADVPQSMGINCLDCEVVVAYSFF